MGLFLFQALPEMLRVLTFPRQEVEVGSIVAISDQNAFSIMGDSPEPDRRFSLVGLMVEVEKPESPFHEDSRTSRSPPTLTIQITTIPAMTSVSPAGNKLGVIANAGL